MRGSGRCRLEGFVLIAGSFEVFFEGVELRLGDVAFVEKFPVGFEFLAGRFECGLRFLQFGLAFVERSGDGSGRSFASRVSAWSSRFWTVAR